MRWARSGFCCIAILPYVLTRHDPLPKSSGASCCRLSPAFPPTCDAQGEKTDPDTQLIFRLRGGCTASANHENDGQSSPAAAECGNIPALMHAAGDAVQHHVPDRPQGVRQEEGHGHGEASRQETRKLDEALREAVREYNTTLVQELVRFQTLPRPRSTVHFRLAYRFECSRAALPSSSLCPASHCKDAMPAQVSIRGCRRCITCLCEYANVSASLCIPVCPCRLRVGPELIA